MIFPNHVQFSGLKLSDTLKEFSITLQFFWLKKFKKQNFEENKGFGMIHCISYKASMQAEHLLYSSNRRI